MYEYMNVYIYLDCPNMQFSYLYPLAKYVNGEMLGWLPVYAVFGI